MPKPDVSEDEARDLAAFVLDAPLGPVPPADPMPPRLPVLDRPVGYDEVATKETSLKLYEMARAVVADRKANPLPVDQDATSSLLAARVDGQPLPEEMIVGTIRQVLVVGIIAPTVMIGSIAVHLSRDPALQQHLREHPELSEAATEEFLRLYTPYRGFARTARTDVTGIHGAAATSRPLSTSVVGPASTTRPR